MPPRSSPKLLKLTLVSKEGEVTRSMEPAFKLVIFQRYALSLAQMMKLLFGFHAFAVGNPHIAEMADKYFNDLTEFSLEAYA